VLYAAWIGRGTATWKFDLTSALIGAVVAWIIAIVIYQKREAIHRLWIKAWEPIRQIRRKMQASQEEKYLQALQGKLRERWLFSPADPRKVFLPPVLETLPPLPRMASESGELPDPMLVPFADLLESYPRLIISGALGSGRTAALIRLAWSVTEGDVAPGLPFHHFPAWIDMAGWSKIPPKVTTPLDRIAQLAAQTVPDSTRQWIAGQLRKEPSLILIDNWDELPQKARQEAAEAIAETAAKLPESIWIIASGLEGYGMLVEKGFVPLQLPLQLIEDKELAILYAGWSGSPTPDVQAIPEEARRLLRWAIETGDSALHLTLRIQLYLRQCQLPQKLSDVLQALLDTQIKRVEAEGENGEIQKIAYTIAIQSMEYLALKARIEHRHLTQTELAEYVVSQIPAGTPHPQKIEGPVRKYWQKSGLIRNEGQERRLIHYVWEEFLAARNLANDPNAVQRFIEHRQDPTWAFFLECFLGMGEATPLIKTVMAESLSTNKQDLMLYATRWATLAPENVAWRKNLMITLAKTFMDPSLDSGFRISLGRGLALVTGENARAFFLQALQQARTVEIRCAALRGLGWTGTPQEMTFLAAALKDPTPEIRISAIHALADLGTPGAFKTLRLALYKSEEDVMLIIAEELARNPEGWEMLKEAAEDNDILIRRATALALGQINKPWANALLQKMHLEDSQWLVRSAAEEAMLTQSAAGKRVIIPSPPAVDQTEWLIQWAARHGSGLGVGDAALLTLIDALRSPEIDAAVLAAQTLAYIGREEHLDVLRPMLDDPRPSVQTAVTAAVSLIEQRYRPPMFDPQSQSETEPV